MRDQEAVDDYKATLTLAEDAPSSSVTLLMRLYIRDAEIDAHRAQLTLEAAGKNVSPAVSSATLSDVRKLLRLLHEANLLCDDFDRLRRRKFHDFVEIPARKKRRRA